ncbi:MAG TPA: dihydroorotase [Candidatus Avidesulfovibrio excrementigallinarum]|nr:dihydroorotase [Candidatus Avidesulfovibrio excrementigallinarum]
MESFILSNALYLGKPVDVVVREGRIDRLCAHGDASLPEGLDLVDARGQILFPSFIDAHTHLREPGFEWKEDVASGLSAAAHGGFGAVMCMANTSPVNDREAVTRFIIERGRIAWPNGPRVHPIGAATIDLKGELMAPLAELREAGCVAISNDGVPLKSSDMLRRVMEYADDLGLMVIDHCEDPWLAKGSCMNEGETSGRLGLRGQPDAAEAIQALRDIMLAEYLGVAVHIAHVSCARTVDAIRWGKSRGVRVSAETCPHYLFLDDSLMEGYNMYARINPPLRTKADVQAIRQAVADGTIDILVTDHSPHATHEKEVPVSEAPNGFTGMDMAVAVTYGLVREGILDEALFIQRWCTQPGKLFNLPVNSFNQGDPADFFLFDPNLEWTVSPETLYSKSCNTPWLGQTLKGRLTAHWMGGRQIV